MTSINDPDPGPDPDPEKSVTMRSFDHERLDVYKKSLEFVGEASKIIENLPSGHSSLAQQLYRAAMSIPLNIAEGSGEYSRRDKARFYRIALRSTTECGAILDVCRELDLVVGRTHHQNRHLLLRIVAMLTAMVRKLSGSGSGPGSGSNRQESCGRVRTPNSEFRIPNSRRA
jgi:four helix bundle protein